MAQRLIKYPRTVLKHRQKDIVQTFKYLLVTDFEATCERRIQIKPQEIIEIPCLAISTEDWQVKDKFHRYVRPRIHPQLTDFCTELTGIIQETVDNEEYFPEVFSSLCDWLKKGGYFETMNTSAFVTCGNWDMNVMLPSQCKLENVTLPEEFKRWIDLKKAFCDATFYFPKSLTDMLMRLKLPMQGHLHSGIDDATNMTRVIQELAVNYNPLFNISHTLSEMSDETLGG